MSTMDRALAASRWDEEYRGGRYVAEPPIPFVETIRSVLQHRGSALAGPGLYVGCGNGRNYLSLIDAGCTLYGLDFSPEALRSLAERRPAIAPSLIYEDFRRFQSADPFSYLIAIQVFQHGTAADVTTYFNQVATLLKPAGLFFLRVNSVSTQIHRAHAIIERTDSGGFTIEYCAGPKQGLPVHFYSREELSLLTRDAFRSVSEPHEEIIVRAPPETGSWAQWEMIWEKR